MTEIKNGEIDIELFETIVEEDGGWVEQTSKQIVDQTRWSTIYSQVFCHKPSDTFVELSWSRGSTEYQDEGVEYPNLTIVKPVEKTITVYEAI